MGRVLRAAAAGMGVGSLLTGLWLATAAFAGMPPVAHFVFSPTPSLSLLMGGSGGAMPVSVEHVRVDPNAACTCDRERPSCAPNAKLGSVVVYWGLPTIDDWPVSTGIAGKCTHLGQDILVDVAFAQHPPEAWRRRDELVVPTTPRMWWGQRVDLPADVNPAEVHVLGDDRDVVFCELQRDGSLMANVRADDIVRSGVHPCATWDGGRFDVRVVPYTR